MLLTSLFPVDKAYLISSYEKGLVLEGKVWFDEIYFPVFEKDRILDEKGRRLPGISRNLIAVEESVGFRRVVSLPLWERRENLQYYLD